MYQWRRQTIIVGLCFAAVMAARVYVNRTLAKPANSVEEARTTEPGEKASGRPSASDAAPSAEVTLDPGH